MDVTKDRYLEQVKTIVLDAVSGQDVRVYLFGSWAEGRQRRASDIDVAIEETTALPPNLLAGIRDRLEVEIRPLPGRRGRPDGNDHRISGGGAARGSSVERLKQRLESASRAYDTLRAVAALDLPDRERRDVAIMRFIYTFEAVWKLAQAYLREHEGIEAASPKSCVRSSFDLALLSAEDTESALVMADDRNLAVHIYIELLAEAIRSRMSGHVAVLGTWLDAIRERMPSRSASAADA